MAEITRYALDHDRNNLLSVERLLAIEGVADPAVFIADVRRTVEFIRRIQAGDSWEPLPLPVARLMLLIENQNQKEKEVSDKVTEQIADRLARIIFEVLVAHMTTEQQESYTAQRAPWKEENLMTGCIAAVPHILHEKNFAEVLTRDIR